jgi:hypothetical protein
MHMRPSAQWVSSQDWLGPAPPMGTQLAVPSALTMEQVSLSEQEVVSSNVHV